MTIVNEVEELRQTTVEPDYCDDVAQKSTRWKRSRERDADPEWLPDEREHVNEAQSPVARRTRASISRSRSSSPSDEEKPRTPTKARRGKAGKPFTTKETHTSVKRKTTTLLTKKSATIARLSEAMASHEAHARDLKAAMEAAKADIESKRVEYERLEKLTETLAQRDEELRQANKHSRQLKRDLADAKAALDEQEKLVTDTRAHWQGVVATLREKLAKVAADAEQERKTHQKLVDELHQKRTAMESQHQRGLRQKDREIQKLNDDLASKEGDIVDLTQDKADLNIQIVDLTNQKEQGLLLIAAKEDEIATLTTHWNDTRKTLGQEMREKRKIQKELGEVYEAVASAESTASVLEGELQDERDGILDMEQDMSKLRTDMSAAEAKANAKLRDVQFAHQTELTNVKMPLQQKLAALKEQLAYKEQQITGLKGTVEGLEGTILTMTGQLSRYATHFIDVTSDMLFETARRAPVSKETADQIVEHHKAKKAKVAHFVQVVRAQEQMDIDGVPLVNLTN